LERATTGLFFGPQRWRLSGDGLNDVATDGHIAQLRVGKSDVATHNDACSLVRVPMAMHGA
jgi:hypothetical protein